MKLQHSLPFRDQEFEVLGICTHVYQLAYILNHQLHSHFLLDTVKLLIPVIAGFIL